MLLKKSISKQVCSSFIILLFTTQCFSQSSLDSNKLSSFQYMKSINKVFEFVQNNYVDELDPRILYEGALNGMLSAIGDPYTLYLDTDEMRSLTDTTAGNFGGVGLSITKAIESTPEKPAYVEVASPIEDTPGSRAGIQSGDWITAIDDLPTQDMDMNEVLAHLRGEVGAPVKVSIKRGTNMNFDVTLIRELIEVPTVKYGMINTTGYLRIIQFTPETPKRVLEAINSFRAEKYTSMVIDLRDNPGGLITSVVDIADMFIDKGPIVSTKSRLVYENRTFNASRATEVNKEMPIVVLINRGSASASEILSGALKDNHLAYLVGERTYGKGSVQQVIPLSNIDGFKITMARYYTPSDTNIDKIGIPPDLEVKYPSFTESNEEAFVRLFDKKVVEDYVAKNPKMTEKDISDFAESLVAEYDLEPRFLRRYIRNQVNRHKETPLYDLDYDIQLQKALEIVEDKNFFNMVKETKTLKELQEEVKTED